MTEEAGNAAKLRPRPERDTNMARLRCVRWKPCVFSDLNTLTTPWGIGIKPSKSLDWSVLHE